jgi:hypothetical protein
MEATLTKDLPESKGERLDSFEEMEGPRGVRKLPSVRFKT